MSQKEKTRPPNFHEKEDWARKDSEFHGNINFDRERRGDGGLMSAQADWKNSEQSHLNKKDQVYIHVDDEKHAKDRKAKELHSNILTHQDKKNDEDIHALYNWDNKAPGHTHTVASNDNWLAQTGHQKPINKGYGIDPYQRKQKELGGHGFSNIVPDAQDYGAFQPLQKPAQRGKLVHDVDPNMNYSPKNRKEEKVIRQFHSHNWLAGRVPGDEYVNNRPEIYVPADKKQDQLLSHMDTHGYIPPGAKVVRDQNQYVEEGRDFFAPAGISSPRKEKIKAQQSHLMGEVWNRENINSNNGRVIDYDISGVPEHWTTSEVKKFAGVRHVVASEVHTDNVKGTCTGTGRIQIRLSAGESELKVKNSYAKAGVFIQTHEENPNKNTQFSRPVNTDDHKLNYLNDKGRELASSNVKYHRSTFESQMESNHPFKR